MAESNINGTVVDSEFITKEQTRLLFLQAPISNATVFGVALLFYFFISYHIESILTSIWVAALYTSASVRLLIWYLHKTRPNILPIKKWLNYYILGSALVGISWSLIYPLIYLANDLVLSIGLFMLIFGIVASAVVILAVSSTAFFVYTYPQIFMLVGTLLSFQETSYTLLSIGVIAYLIMTTLFVKNVNRNMLRKITLEAQNSELIKELNNEVNEREDLIQQRTAELQDKNIELTQEIDERQRIESALRKSEERFELAMQGTNDGIFDWDLINNSIYYSPRWKLMLGYSDDELPNDFSVWEELTDPVDREKSWDMLTDYINLRRDNFKLEFKMKHKDGHWIDILSRAFLVRDSSGKATRVVGTHIDITEKKRQEQLIIHQAHYDDLTQLPNRFLALDRLKQLIKESKRLGLGLAVIFLDLDGFKRINDTLGHETGDKLLVQAAKRLKSIVREGDSVCRLGGDEFIVLLGGINKADDARPVALNIIANFRKPFSLNERDLLITCSLGIAVYPNDGNSAEELLRKADTAMYHSKEQGRNEFNYFTDSMNQEVSRRMEVEQQLHGALMRGEFTLKYQPLVNLKDGGIIGVEVLLRWQNPVIGNVSPNEFIPIAEQTGAIIEIGHFVLKQAMSAIDKWSNLIPSEFRLAVNISPRQFRNPEFKNNILQLLKQHKLSPQFLELEITEGVLLEGSQYINDVLLELAEMGIRISMDDFGTGYSSLNYLRQYPFHTLKIDRSFINDILIDQNDRELVNATILMAHGLGLEVVAEGVELSEQQTALCEMGCNNAQGFLFSRPVDMQAISILLAEQKDSQLLTNLSSG